MWSEEPYSTINNPIKTLRVLYQCLETLMKDEAKQNNRGLQQYLSTGLNVPSSTVLTALREKHEEGAKTFSLSPIYTVWLVSLCPTLQMEQRAGKFMQHVGCCVGSTLTQTDVSPLECVMSEPQYTAHRQGWTQSLTGKHVVGLHFTIKQEGAEDEICDLIDCTNATGFGLGIRTLAWRSTRVTSLCVVHFKHTAQCHQCFTVINPLSQHINGISFIRNGDSLVQCHWPIVAFMEPPEARTWPHYSVSIWSAKQARVTAGRH